ncbi:hypothetical protein [Segniliparus rugosus]|uniref:Uncharacterized protein n=1 Tax=Segniliparus rugosus (strain ATCC BAA-974 / DSM 45345 / CCUG 50838 / CIP 108380 / JCM 13579 / CDC 945) TaxID=679197 RepID=U1M277_SEGRC|nr:hypothetical protein [Segniliparus rugosus]ERG69190.1 hypothetical protein HMPREF9336_04334 [Segniliparus rugosus ATCC BAA-974]
MAAFGLAKQSRAVLRGLPKLAWSPVIAMFGAIAAFAQDLRRQARFRQIVSAR